LFRQNAKTSGDSAKARRFGRGLATLNEQKKKVKAGKAVDPDDIPPGADFGICHILLEKCSDKF
jgi:coiled-coil and C2 domain-containing protein 1